MQIHESDYVNKRFGYAVLVKIVTENVHDGLLEASRNPLGAAKNCLDVDISRKVGRAWNHMARETAFVGRQRLNMADACWMHTAICTFSAHFVTARRVWDVRGGPFAHRFAFRAAHLPRARPAGFRAARPACPPSAPAGPCNDSPRRNPAQAGHRGLATMTACMSSGAPAPAATRRSRARGLGAWEGDLRES